MVFQILLKKSSSDFLHDTCFVMIVPGSLRYNIKQLEDGKSRKDPSIVVEDLITVSAAY